MLTYFVLFTAPPPFKLKKSPKRSIESKSPFSTDRQYDLPKVGLEAFCNMMNGCNSSVSNGSSLKKNLKKYFEKLNKKFISMPFTLLCFAFRLLYNLCRATSGSYIRFQLFQRGVVPRRFIFHSQWQLLVRGVTYGGYTVHVHLL